MCSKGCQKTALHQSYTALWQKCSFTLFSSRCEQIVINVTGPRYNAIDVQIYTHSFLKVFTHHRFKGNRRISRWCMLSRFKTIRLKGQFQFWQFKSSLLTEGSITSSVLSDVLNNVLSYLCKSFSDGVISSNAHTPSFLRFAMSIILF